MKSPQNIKNILIIAFLLRIAMLLITIICSDNLTEGYLRSTYVSDDLRYIDGAIEYSHTANSIIDVPAFVAAYASVGDNTGMADYIALWYWLMAIMMYLFKYAFIVKVINILFAVVCVYLIYKIVLKAFPSSSEIATKAAFLYAVFPYPVIFSCFLYKDQFLTLLLLAIIYLTYLLKENISVVKIISLILLLLFFNLTRSGLLLILIVSIAIILIDFNKSKRGRNLTIGIIFLTIGYYVYTSMSDVVASKLESYVFERANSSELNGTIIQYFLINKVTDIWKLPFAVGFNLLTPLYLGGHIINWEGVVGLFNFISIPMVVANVYYFVFTQKSNTQFFWAIMLLYGVVIVVSLGITRHSYFLLPFPMMFYADVLVNSGNVPNIIRTSSKAIMIVYCLVFIPIFLATLV